MITIEMVRGWLRPWLRWREERPREDAVAQLRRAVPDFDLACQLEEECLRRGYTKGIRAARDAKRAALLRALGQKTTAVQ